MGCSGKRRSLAIGTMQRVVIAALSTIGAAVGTVLGVASAFVLGTPLGWGIGAAVLVATTTGGAILGRRLASAGQVGGTLTGVVVATLVGLLIALMAANRVTSCAAGDAVLWQCGPVAWVGAFGGAVLGLWISDASRRGASR